MHWRGWLKYRIDELLARSAWGKITLLLVFTAGVILLGMTVGLLGLFDPDNAEVEGIVLTHGDWRDALWWAVRHILDPTFFYAQHGATTPVMAVSLAVSIGGLVMFGALLGLIIAVLEERLDVLRRGDSPVRERGHVLILGWNNKVPEVVALLQQRRQRQTLVVLAPHEPDELRESLRAAGVDARQTRLVLRSGMADSLAELERMAWAQAQAVMVLPSDALEPTAADAAVVRTILLLQRQARPDGLPKIVAEIGRQAHAEAARRAGAGIPVVTSAEVVARMLFQCAFQRHLSLVFDEILSPRGASIRVRPAPACAGMRFDELVWAYPSAIPLGISRAVADAEGQMSFQHVLSPPPGYRLAKDEWVLLLSGQEEEPSVQDVLPSEAGELPVRASVPEGRQSILLLGWSDSLVRLLQEFDDAAAQPADLTVVSALQAQEAWEALADAGVVLRRIEPRFERLDVLLPGAMASLDPARFDAIVALADTSWGNADADARTLMNLVVLKPLLDQAGVRPRLVVEALSPATREAAHGLHVDDLVIGPQVISRMLMMVSEQMMVAHVLADLLSSVGDSLAMRPVTDYVPAGHPCDFGDVVRLAQARREIAVGICVAASSAGEAPMLRIAPPRGRAGEPWLPGPQDRVVVLVKGVEAP